MSVIENDELMFRQHMIDDAHAYNLSLPVPMECNCMDAAGCELPGLIERMRCGDLQALDTTLSFFQRCINDWITGAEAVRVIGDPYVVKAKLAELIMTTAKAGDLHPETFNLSLRGFILIVARNKLAEDRRMAGLDEDAEKAPVLQFNFGGGSCSQVSSTSHQNLVENCLGNSAAA